jgi:hypothetical protein
MARKMRSYPTARAVEVLCGRYSFCGKPCTGRTTCERINPAYDPDWTSEADICELADLIDLDLYADLGWTPGA